MLFKPESKDSKNDEDSNTPPNNGTLILDATCIPADITYPQDINLINEAREKTEKMVETMHKANKGKYEKPRLDKTKAHRVI